MRALVCTAAFIAATPAFASREAVHRVSAAVAAPGVRIVTIAIPDGGITVRNGAVARLSLDGMVRLRHDTQRFQEMQQIVNDIGFTIEVRGDHATIARTFGPNAHGWRAHHSTEFEATIEVPPGVLLEVETHFGEVQMDGSFGGVDVNLRAGELTLRMPKGDVRTLEASVLAGENHANFGDRVVTREGLFSGRTKFAGSGRADVNLHVTAGELRVTLVP
jgi:hypothetical protein